MAIDYKKLRERQKKAKKAKESDRFQNIINFLSTKGFLILNQPPKVIRNKKIDIKDILWATNYEPRILEVFPAAYLHFPKKFKNLQKAPKKLLKIITQLENNEEHGDDYKWLAYQDMKRWCRVKLKDKRTTPLNHKKVLRSFTLNPEIDEKLTKLALSQNTTKTKIIEKLVENL